MATKTKKGKKKLAKAKKIVKKINSDLIDASFEAIETTVKTGEKWQKLTSKLVKKAEPLTKQQVNMFVETAESIKSQLENGTDRLKNLIGYDNEMFDQAKKMVVENPLTKKAEKMTAKFKKEVTKNPLVKKAEKMSTKIKKEISETIEDITDDVKETVEDVLKGSSKTKAKKPKAKKAATKRATTKKTTTRKRTATKPVVRKPAVKKAVVKKTTVKNDLKVIKGIGPKMEVILNEKGITSYEDLSKITLKNLNKVLTDAGIINLKIYNTSDWKVQAKLAVKEAK